MVSNFTQVKVCGYVGGDDATGDQFFNLYTVPDGATFDGSLIASAFLSSSGFRLWIFPLGVTAANGAKGIIEYKAITQGTPIRVDGLHLKAGDRIYVLCDDANSGASSTSLFLTGVLTT
jgi:hypothetical protein